MRKSILAVGAAAALTLGVAAPAMAQYPGTNGHRFYDADSEGVYACSDSSNSDAWEDRQLGQGLGQEGGTWSPDGNTQAVNTGGFYYNSSHLPGNGVGTLVMGPAAGKGNTDCAGFAYYAGVDVGSHLAFSHDAKTLAVERGSRVYEITTSTGKVVRDLTPNLPKGTYADDPTWSATTNTIAYAATDGIRTRPSGGGSATLLVKVAGARDPEYSPDGKYIAYIAGGTIQYASATTGKLVKNTKIKAADFRYSPDGKDFYISQPDFGAGISAAGGTASCPVITLAGVVIARDPGDGDSPPACVVIDWQPVTRSTKTSPSVANAFRTLQ